MHGHCYHKLSLSILLLLSWLLSLSCISITYRFVSKKDKQGYCKIGFKSCSPKVSDKASSLQRKIARGSSELALPHAPFAPWQVDLQELSPPWNLESQKWDHNKLQPKAWIWPAKTRFFWLTFDVKQEDIGCWLMLDWQLMVEVCWSRNLYN